MVNWKSVNRSSVRQRERSERGELDVEFGKRQGATLNLQKKPTDKLKSVILFQGQP